MDASALIALWETRLPGSRPIAHELRYDLHHRWVRFHSLPESKRYPENEAECTEVHLRYVTVLAELIAETDRTLAQDVLVITASWSGTANPIRRHRYVRRAIQATYWRSVLEAKADDGEEWWIHLYVSHVRVHSPSMTRLLRLVADDRTDGVIITDLDLAWLYLPYDGGADVIAPTDLIRDDLWRSHQDWLSVHPSGM